MVRQCSMRQVDEKHLANEAEHMIWSPRMDLIAVSNVQSEVILYRLSWQKVWTLAPPSDDVTVAALSWRPDGKIVAVGYSSGHMVLCDIENSDVLHSADMIGGICHMTWISQVFPEDSPWTFKPYVEDSSETFIPKLQPHAKNYDASKKGNSEEPVEDSKKLKNQKELNVLLVGTNLDTAHLYIYGVFPIACITLQSASSTARRVISGVLSHDLTQLCLVVECPVEESRVHYKYLIYDTSVLYEKQKEIRQLALKYGQIYSLLGYLDQTVKLMCEAWEDILVEMDKKLLKFSEEKRNFGMGTVSNDLLELLMFGTASSQLEAFLLHELTEKGLKKLGHSIETSYSNIQKLVVKHLRNVSHAIVYHTSELRGLSRWEDKYDTLGLRADLVEVAVKTAGSFVLKTSELQQVIDGSITNFKAFFRWLYVAILRLSEQVPHADISKMTQYDINFVAEFLKDNFSQFTEEDEVEASTLSDHHKQGFKLEKVGQYLKDENLHYLANVSGNPWVQFLNNSTHTKESSLLYPTHMEKSLIQLQHHLIVSINTALNEPAEVIGEKLTCCAQFSLFGVQTDKGGPRVKLSQYCVGDNMYTAYLSEAGDRLYVVRHPVTNHGNAKGAEIGCFKLGCLPLDTSQDLDSSQQTRCCNHKFVDVSFYDDKTVSVLVEAVDGENTPAMIQLTMTSLTSLTFTSLDLVNSTQCTLDCEDISGCIEPGGYVVLDNMKAASFAVSGTRKVACVLFSSRRRVRLFLMDAEDDDEDETLDDTDAEQMATSPVVVDIEGEDKENTRLVT